MKSQFNCSEKLLVRLCKKLFNVKQFYGLGYKYIHMLSWYVFYFGPWLRNFIGGSPIVPYEIFVFFLWYKSTSSIIEIRLAVQSQRCARNDCSRYAGGYSEIRLLLRTIHEVCTTPYAHLVDLFKTIINDFLTAWHTRSISAHKSILL